MSLLSELHTSKQFLLPTITNIIWHSEPTLQWASASAWCHHSHLTLSRSWHAAPTLGHSGTCRMSDLTCSNSLSKVAMFHNRSHLVALTLSTWWDKSINKELQIKLFLRLLRGGWWVPVGACWIFVIIILIIHNNKGNTDNVHCNCPALVRGPVQWRRILGRGHVCCSQSSQ